MGLPLAERRLFRVPRRSSGFLVLAKIVGESWRDPSSCSPSSDMPAAAALPDPIEQEDGRAPEIQSQKNNSLSFDEFYRKWFFDVCRWARAMGGLHADIEDIAQEVFLVVRRKYDAFDGAHPRAWLYRITQRRVNDYRRRAWFKKAVRPTVEFFAQVEDPGDGPQELLRAREAEKQLVQVLEKMSLVRRTAFILYEFEGYSGEEIAQLEGVPAKTIHSRLGRARKDFIKYAGELYRAEWRDTWRA